MTIDFAAMTPKQRSDAMTKYADIVYDLGRSADRLIDLGGDRDQFVDMARMAFGYAKQLKDGALAVVRSED